MMEKNNNISKKDWELLGRYLTGEMSPEERMEFNQLCNKNAGLKEETEKSQKMIEKVDMAIGAGRFNPENALATVLTATNQKTELRKSIKLPQLLMRYAALFAALLIIGSIGYYFMGKNGLKPLKTQMVTTAGLSREVLLPDGSKVSLNRNSTLSFPETFNGQTREVKLYGEAYFDVAHNVEKPFIIHAGNARIKVVGTSFNVDAYPENQSVEVTVETGKVLFDKENPLAMQSAEAVFLMPGEKGKLTKEKNRIEKTQNPDPNYLAWKTLTLTFDKTPLSEVIENIKKVYNVDIQLEPGLETLRLTAKFDQRPVEFVLNVIKMTFDLELVNNESISLLQSKKTN